MLSPMTTTNFCWENINSQERWLQFCQFLVIILNNSYISKWLVLVSVLSWGVSGLGLSLELQHVDLGSQQVGLGFGLGRDTCGLGLGLPVLITSLAKCYAGACQFT